MTIFLWMIAAALALDAGFIGASLIGRLLGFTTTPLLPDIAQLLAAAAIFIALTTFLTKLRRERSDDTLKAAIDLLEKAYGMLSSTEDRGKPSNRRLSWLSSARLVATAEELAGHVTDRSHQLIYDRTREYWRNRLYELICPSQPDGLPSTFFAERPEHMVTWSDEHREPISERSIAYLYRFIHWSETTVDPIGEVPKFSEEEIEKMLAFGPRGLGRLLREVRNFDTPKD